MKRVLFLSTLLFFASVGHAKNKPASKPSPAPTPYKLGQVKTPYDPFAASLEASSPSVLSIVLTLGLIFFYRNTSLHYQEGGTRVQINAPR